MLEFVIQERELGDFLAPLSKSALTPFSPQCILDWCGGGRHNMVSPSFQKFCI